MRIALLLCAALVGLSAHAQAQRVRQPNHFVGYNAQMCRETMNNVFYDCQMALRVGYTDGAVSYQYLNKTAPNAPAMGFFSAKGPEADGAGHVAMVINLVTLTVTEQGQAKLQGFPIGAGDGICLLDSPKQTFKCVAKTAQGMTFHGEFAGNMTQPIVTGGPGG
jgi:hypothetical protein